MHIAILILYTNKEKRKMLRKLTKALLLSSAVMMVVSLTGIKTNAMEAAVANPTNSNILVNGQKVEFEAYNIKGENYFKLRDLAFVLNGTTKQFAVDYDPQNDAILLSSGKAYKPVGGELSKGQSGSKTPSNVASKLCKNGRQFYLMSYKIGGNNFFKLRDIAAVFDIGIGWDDATKTITISSGEGYVQPKSNGTVPYLNTYYLTSLGMSVDELNARFGTGKIDADMGIIYYPQGFYIAAIKGNQSSSDGDAVSVSMNGNVSLLINNCPSILSLAQIKEIFGSATVNYSEYSDDYYVSVPYAGEKITMVSNSKGDVSAKSRFNFNPLNRINLYDDSKSDKVANGMPYKKRFMYTPDGTLSNYFIPEYDRLNNMKKLTWYFEDGTSGHYELFDYDSTGTMTKRYEYYKNGSLYRYFLPSYDDRGKMVRETWYDAGDRINGIIDYSYDSNDTLVKASWYVASKLTLYDIYEYSAEGKLVKVSSYFADGKLAMYYLYEY